MIDPDGFFIKLFPTVWAQMEPASTWDAGVVANTLGLPPEDLDEMHSTEINGRCAAALTLRIVESALSQVKKIREDRDRDFQRNHR